MSAKNWIYIVLLAAIWGGSFLFMRIAAPEFGAVPLVGLRLAIATLALLPFMLAQGSIKEFRGRWKFLTIIGISNAAIPFGLFAYATIHITAGFTSVLNSVAPIFTAVIGYLWLRQTLSVSAVLGLLLGLLGVIVLVQDGSNLQTQSQWLAAAAATFATLLYGFAANFNQEYKGSLSPMAVSGGSLFVGALVLLPATVLLWPETMPSARAWMALIGLGVFCTGLAVSLYFIILQEVSANMVMTVTYMVPMFGMFWGYLFLDESVTSYMLLGCAAILLGVALTTGLFDRGKKA